MQRAIEVGPKTEAGASIVAELGVLMHEANVSLEDLGICERVADLKQPRRRMTA